MSFPIFDNPVRSCSQASYTCSLHPNAFCFLVQGQEQPEASEVSRFGVQGSPHFMTPSIVPPYIALPGPSPAVGIVFTCETTGGHCHVWARPLPRGP